MAHVPTERPGSDDAPTPDRITLRTLARMAQAGTPFACLTCYDATTARWLARGGVHVLLVGDTAAEMVLGFNRTIDMDLGVLLALTAGVKRGAPSRIVMADMPFMSYQASEDEALRNAGRFLTEGLADIVKVEVDESFGPLVARMVRAGIPICGHVGSRPQRTALTGGYAAAGRTAADADRIVRDARAMEQAGCSMLLIEAVPEQVTERVLRGTSIPVIGIGAGAACHGQVLVLQDLLGMTDHPPRFVEPLASLGEQIARAGSQWVERVAQRRIGGAGYEMKPGEAENMSGGRNGHEPAAAPKRNKDHHPATGAGRTRRPRRSGS